MPKKEKEYKLFILIVPHYPPRGTVERVNACDGQYYEWIEDVPFIRQFGSQLLTLPEFIDQYREEEIDLKDKLITYVYIKNL